MVRFSTGALAAMTLTIAGLAAAEPVKTKAGLVEGTATADQAVRAFLGVPYAAPPVGELRWREPQPAAPWQGVRKATAFGARCPQGRIFDDMVFRDEPAEDCLYLNVWTPARSEQDKLPVMVWIYGGGFQAGSASEPRQQGDTLARKGVVVVSMNYRLGVFGFFSHAELRAGVAEQGLGQLRAARPARRAALGPGQRRGLRRRSRQRHHLRRERGLLLGQRARRLAARPWPLPARDRRERRLRGPQRTAAGAARRTRRRPARPSPRRSAPRPWRTLRKKTADELLQAALQTQPWFAPTVDGHLLPRRSRRRSTPAASRTR